MKDCPHCQRKIPAAANYCPYPTCNKPVRAALFSWLSWRMDALLIGFVFGLLLGMAGIIIIGGGGKAEPKIITVIETVVVEPTAAEPEVVTVKETVVVEPTQVVEVPAELRRIVEPTASPPPTQPPAFSAGDTRLRAKDGMTMVYVPAGGFQMGSNESDLLADDDEKPEHSVTLSAFWIDQTEVTNAQFVAFLNEQGNQKEADSTWLEIKDQDALIEQQGDTFQAKDRFTDHPAIEVSWYGAKAYCQWAGGRLPTEAEWEYAARGPEGLIYPWGNQFDDSLANCSICDDNYLRTAPVGTFPAGASWVGALDMAGNVWEWTNDWYESQYYASSPEVNPQGFDGGTRKVLRGGSWNIIEARNLRAAYRFIVRPTVRHNIVGLRCVSSDQEALINKQ